MTQNPEAWAACLQKSTMQEALALLRTKLVERSRLELKSLLAAQIESVINDNQTLARMHQEHGLLAENGPEPAPATQASQQPVDLQSIREPQTKRILSENRALARIHQEQGLLAWNEPEPATQG